MKRLLFSLLIINSGLLVSAQVYWPHTSTPYPRCISMTTNCTKWPVVNNGNWNSGSTWNNGTVPSTDDIVCIPSGTTVVVAHSTYSETNTCPPTSTPSAPRLQIFVCGIIQFNNSGQLNLSCNSFIQIYSGGSILPPATGSGSSDLIQIGSKVVWGGPGSGNQPPINGPMILSDPYIGAGVLAVAFDYFKAEQKQPYTVRLEWATLLENNSSSFIIEKSTDQKIWSEIGSLAARGNTNSRTTYSHLDLQPVNGYNYYRLKQVDLDGQIVYSEIVRFNNQIRKNLSVFPNPVTDIVQLYGKEQFKAGQTIQIIDATGKRVKMTTAPNGNRLQIDLSGYTSGLYLLQLIENGKVLENLQIVKQ